MNIRAGQGPRVSRQKHAYPPRRHIYKTNDGGNIFAADVHTHIHRLFPGTRARALTHTHTHTGKDTRTRSPTLTHRHWLLQMWVTGPCSPSSVRKQSRSLLCSPTASARRKHRLQTTAAVLFHDR